MSACIHCCFFQKNGPTPNTRTIKTILERQNISCLKVCRPIRANGDLLIRVLYYVHANSSGRARKRPRLLEEAVKADDGVALKFSESFAADNQNLVLLQVRWLLEVYDLIDAV